ncbi:unnamed protein product, partial [Adineta steineri]
LLLSLFAHALSVMYKFYSVTTICDIKSSLRQSIENTIFNVSAQGSFLNNSIEFYIYTLFRVIF